MNKIARRFAAVLALSLMVTGCASGPPKIHARAWNIIISKGTNTPNIDVDMIGVADLEKPTYDGYAVDKYWSPDDPMRTGPEAGDAKFSVTWDADKPFMVSKKDPKWQLWKKRGVTWLLILARLPGDFKGVDGTKDPRRVWVTLDSGTWKGDTLKFEVLDTRIVPQMQMK